VGVPAEQVFQLVLVDLDHIGQLERLVGDAFGDLAFAHVQVQVALGWLPACARKVPRDCSWRCAMVPK
jgi:hypothetical protein